MKDTVTMVRSLWGSIEKLQKEIKTLEGATSSGGGGSSEVSIGGAISGGTVGSVLFVGTSAVLAQDNTNFFWDDTNNRLGLGINTPTGRLIVQGTTSNSSATDFQVLNSLGDNLLYVRNDQSSVFGSGSANTQVIIGGTGSFAGFFSPVYASMASNIISFRDFDSNTRMTLNMATNSVGRLGINSTPTAYIHMGAGTATAGTAPLKFTSGTNLTTGETGAVEYNGTNLFFTRSGTTRETVLTGVTSTAPLSSGSGAPPATFWGSATNWMGDPASWLNVVVAGTLYKVPLYSPS